jgi:hypothetical protein
MGEQPETESLSIEDRLAAQFEPEQPDAGPQEEQQPEVEASTESQAQPEFEEIEYEGKAYQVPPELKDAILRQSDYTRKTTEVAERQRALEQKELQVKAFEAEKSFRDSVKDDFKAIDRLDYQIEQWKSVDVTGMSSEEMWKLSRQVEQLKDKRAELSNSLNQKWQGFQQQQMQLAQEAKQKALDHVSKSIKGWGAEAQKFIREYATSKGISAHALDNIGDPVFVEILHDAASFKKLQAQTVQGKVTSVPTVKPGSSNPMPQQVKNDLALRKQQKNPKLTSAQRASVIQKRLESMF